MKYMSAGTYNLNLGDIYKNSIRNSVCFRGSLVVPDARYLRSGKYSDRTFKSLFEDACLGAVETQNRLGLCDQGFLKVTYLSPFNSKR
jgi:hypothetical protein